MTEATGALPAIIKKILEEVTHQPTQLSDTDLAMLASRVQKRHLEEEEAFVSPSGEPEVWIVANGKIRVEEHGRMVDIIEAPTVLGDFQALTGRTARHGYKTETPVNALVLSFTDFKDLFAQAPTMAKEWANVFAHKLEQETDKREYLLAGNLNQQIGQLLLQKEKDGKVELTQGYIAALLGVHRASVSRGLHALSRQGCITINYANVDIKNIAKLRKFVNS